MNDLLYGTKGIGAHLGISAKAVVQRVRRGQIPPAFKIGGTIVARRASLDAWMAEAEAKAIAARQPAPVTEAA